MMLTRWIISIVVPGAVVGGAYALGAVPRLHTAVQTARDTTELSVPYVTVVHPQPAAPAQEVVLPGDAQPFASAPIFARTNGYIEGWYVDIGAHVKKDQVLATIATPEVDQQLAHTRATLASARAAQQLAESTASRYGELAATHAVSKQDIENAEAARATAVATVDADSASVRQLEQLQSFEQVRAPFDGIVSVRNAQIGQLVNAGSSTVAQTELFHIVQVDPLRVFVNVPEALSAHVTKGLSADLVLEAFPGRHFIGPVTRTANAITPSTRTLDVEIDVDNPHGELFAGSYAQVHLSLPGNDHTFTVPIETLLFRKDGLTVAKVVDGRVVLVAVQVGRDFGERIEIVDGVDASDVLIVNPSDSITAGEPVRVATGATR